MVDLVDDVTGMVEHMNTAATADPISAVLLTAGTLIIGVTVLIGGWLLAGAIASTLRSAVI